MGLTSHISYIYDVFFSSRIFFFDDEYGNDGSVSGSSGMFPFLFPSENSVGRVSDSGSEIVKYPFPFFDGEMVNSFFDGEMWKFRRVIEIFSKIGQVTEIFSKVGRFTEIFSKIGRVTEIFSRSKTFIVSNSFLEI